MFSKLKSNGRALTQHRLEVKGKLLHLKSFSGILNSSEFMYIANSKVDSKLSSSMTLKQLCVHVYDRHMFRGGLCLSVTCMPTCVLLHEVRSWHNTFLRHSSLYLVRQILPLNPDAAISASHS